MNCKGCGARLGNNKPLPLFLHIDRLVVKCPNCDYVTKLKLDENYKPRDIVLIAEKPA